MVLSTAQNDDWVASPFAGVSYNFLKIGTGNPAVVALRKVTAGHSMPPHRHPSTERNYLVSGRAQMLDGTIVEAGTYVEIAAGVRHGATALEDTVWLDNYDGSLVWVEDSGTMTSVNSSGGFDVLGAITPPNSSNLDLGH